MAVIHPIEFFKHSNQVNEMEDVSQHCLHKGDYGYTDGQPCVIVKMNKIFEFIPELTGSADYLKIKCRGNFSANAGITADYMFSTEYL